MLGAARDIAGQLRAVGCEPRQRELLVSDVGDSATISLCPEDFVGALVFRDDEGEGCPPYLAIELRDGCELRIAEWPEPAADQLGGSDQRIRTVTCRDCLEPRQRLIVMATDGSP